MSVIGSPVRGIAHCTRRVRAGRATGCRADEAGDRCTHLREGEIQRRGVDGSLGRGDIGRRLLIARGALVELFLRDGALLDQSRGAFALGLRQRTLRACPGQFGLCLLELGLVGTRVDDVEDVALLDLVALLEMRGGDVARHPRAHFHALDGFEAARELVELGDGLRQHLGHLHGGRGGRRFGSFVARASCGEQRDEKDDG